MRVRSSSGRWRTASSRPRRSTTCRCRRSWSARSSSTGPPSSRAPPRSNRVSSDRPRMPRAPGGVLPAKESDIRMNAIALPALRDHKDARNDRMFRYVLVATVVFVLLALTGAALSMLWGGRQALEASGLDFFFSADWNPVENRYGALVPIYGTVVTAIIAMVIAIPVSFGIAFFLTEVAPR